MDGRGALRAFAIAATIAAAAGCAAPSGGRSGAESGPALVVALRGDVDSWNPYVTEDATSAYLLDLLYPRLVHEAGTVGREFEPWLAESWEPAPDGLAWSFHLRDDARWSDGTPVTCEDVRFTFEIQTSDDLAWDGAFLKKRIVGVDCPDPHTAVFRYSGRYADQILDANDDAIVPRAYARVPLASWRATAWETVATTCGPFALESVTPGQETVLVRDPRWWGAAGVAPPRVVLRTHPDVGVAIRLLLAGEVDVLPRVPPRHVEEIARSPGARIVELPSLTFTYIGWNVLAPDAYAEAIAAGATDDADLIARLRREHPHPFLADSRVRRALDLAIDRDDLVRGLWGGHAERVATPILAPWARDDAGPPRFDPGRARALLRDAGFRDDDGDGVLERGEDPLEIRVLINADSALRRDVLDRIARNLALVGVRLLADPVPRAEFNARARDKRFDAILAGRVAGTRVEPQATLHGRAAADRGNNVTSWSTPESDALLDRAAAAPTREAARPLWLEWQRVFRDEQPYSVLFAESTIVGLSRRVRGEMPSSFNPFLGLPVLRVADDGKRR